MHSCWGLAEGEDACAETRKISVAERFEFEVQLTLACGFQLMTGEGTYAKAGCGFRYTQARVRMRDESSGAGAHLRRRPWRCRRERTNVAKRLPLMNTSPNARGFQL